MNFILVSIQLLVLERKKQILDYQRRFYKLEVATALVSC
jgi:hypothetical protein